MSHIDLGDEISSRRAAACGFFADDKGRGAGRGIVPPQSPKKLSKFGTTLFGYLNSKVKANDLHIIIFQNCHTMYCIHLVRAMSQLHFKTNISSLRSEQIEDNKNV